MSKSNDIRQQNRIEIRGIINNIQQLTEDRSISGHLTQQLAVWQRCKARFDVYGSLTQSPGPSTPTFDEWLFGSERMSKIQVRDRLEMIELALGGLKLIDQSSAGAAKEQLYQLFSSITEVELMEMELEQLKKLQKDQEIRRPDMIKLKEEQNASARIMLKTYNAMEMRKILDGNNAQDQALLAFFAMYDQKIQIQKKLRILLAEVTDNSLSKAQDINKVMNLSLTMLDALKAISEGAFNVLKALGGVLTAVPIVSSILSGMASLYQASRTWFKSKSIRKQWYAGLSLAVFFIGGIVLASLFPVAAPAIALGVTAYGLFIGILKPLHAIQKKIKAKHAELKSVKQRLHVLIRNPAELTPLECDELSTLNTDEKHALLIAIERYSYLHSDARREEVLNLVRVGNINQLKTNAYFKEMLTQDYPEIKTVNQFLIIKGIDREESLRKDLVTLRKVEKKSLALATNGLLAFAGFFLIFIPTPPTIIIGISLLAVTTVVGLAIKYDLMSQVQKWLNNRGITDKKPTIKYSERTDNVVKNTMTQDAAHKKTRILEARSPRVSIENPLFMAGKADSMNFLRRRHSANDPILPLPYNDNENTPNTTKKK